MVNYKEELERAMKMLAEHPKTLFIGQNTVYGGTSMFWTINTLPIEKRIELPVFEDVQSGISIGLALEGYIPISLYPRMDFLLLAFNQIINHLDKAEEMSDGKFKPKVIIRTAIGSVKPLMPGPQHCQDYYKELKTMCKNIDIVLIEKAEQVFDEYKKALESKRSTILIELPDIYNQELEEILADARKKPLIN